MDYFTLIMQNVTLPAEGGLSDNPNDPGGLTNRGLLLPDLRRFSRGATAADLRSLTVNETLGIYLALYWQPLRATDLPAGVACMVFDHGVNAGIGTSAKILQRIVGAECDGVIGNLTIASTAAYAAGQGALISALGDAQAADYASKANAATFLTGWDARLARRFAYALTLI